MQVMQWVTAVNVLCVGFSAFIAGHSESRQARYWNLGAAGLNAFAAVFQLCVHWKP